MNTNPLVKKAAVLKWGVQKHSSGKSNVTGSLSSFFGFFHAVYDRVEYTKYFLGVMRINEIKNN